MVWRKRKDGHLKCNENLLNEDQKWRESVSQIVGCTPFYWKIFFANISNENRNYNCTKKQLGQVEEYHNYWERFENVSIPERTKSGNDVGLGETPGYTTSENC